MKKCGLLLLSILAVACSPRVAPPPAVVLSPTHDTLIVRDYRVDSFYVHESERTQHDTVYLTRIKEHYSILRDTIRTSHTDTIVKIVESPCPSWGKERERGQVPWYYRYPALAMYALLGAIVGLIVVRVAVFR